MFKEHQVQNMYLTFTLGEVKQGIDQIDHHVKREWLGTRDEALTKRHITPEQPIPSIIENEGYWVIPMGDGGVAFDYGDTNSDGLKLVDCVPYGESKEVFKEQLLKNLNEMKRILEM